MSSVSKTRVPKRMPEEEDPFRYGWRYVRVQRPDGTEDIDEIPLTLEDVLFPEVGDFIVQTDFHNSDLMYLKEVFKSRLAGDPRAVVLSDCRIDWNVPGVRPLGPDIAVFFDVKRHKDWATFDVAAEGARPMLVVEVTAPATRVNDVKHKFKYYYRAGVPLYVIADVPVEDASGRRIRLTGYRRGQTRFEPIALDERGWLWLEPVGLWLGITRDGRTGDDRLACYDPENGTEIGDYTAVEAARQQAEARAAAEELARQQAESRAATAAARAKAASGRAKAASGRAKAEADKRRQAEERAQAEAEARRLAEARIRELEAALKQLGRDR